MGGIFEIMEDVDSCLIGSIGQAVTDAGWTDIWTMQTLSKNEYWLTKEDPYIKNDIEDGPGAANPLPNDSAQDDAEWIQTFCSNYINRWSSALVLELQSIIAKWYTKDDWGAVLGAVGSFASMVSAATTQDTTTGETEGKNMQSQMQTDNSALQPISDFGSSYSQFLSALANVLSQVGPGA